MLRITVELLPGGLEINSRVLARAELYNDGGESTDGKDSIMGSYKIRLYGGTQHPNLSKVWRTGNVRHFPRLRLGVWDLLFRALRDAVGFRNKEMP